MQDATTRRRCLARLAQLTDWSLLVKLWPVALQIGRLIADFRSGPLSAEKIARFEWELQRLQTKFGRVVVQWTLNRLEPPERADMSPLVFWECEAFRPKRLSPMRNLNCLFGPICVKRWLYEAMDGLQLPALFPLERRWVSSPAWRRPRWRTWSPDFRWTSHNGKCWSRCGSRTTSCGGRRRSAT